MPAIDNFKKTIERAGAMVRLHTGLCPRGKPRAEHADLLRAAIVLSVSAMDGYFHEKVVENVPRFVRIQKGKNLPGRLVQVIKEKVSHDKLIEILFEERPLSHLATIIRKATADRTYQDPAKIEQAVGMLGVDDLWFQIGRKLGVPKGKAKKYIQSYVQRRHQIVHRGDFGQTKKTKNRLNRISRNYADRCVKEVNRFVKAIDEIIEARLEKLEKQT